ncbi:MAG: SIMPL domain-containing protein, partial [Bacteroidota bacterium]
MRYFIILISFIFIATTTQAQNELSINASAEVMVPADKIVFQINLNAEGDNPQETYELHKEREKVLVEQLKKHNIEEDDLTFDPISINKTYNGNPQQNQEKRVQTRQSVILTLGDFDIYEEIQITLIENNFDEFSGNFTSSESKKGEDEALRKALKQAREKAEIIAEESGLTITGIKNINHSSSSRPPRPMMEMTASKTSDGNLLEFDQSVSVSA